MPPESVSSEARMGQKQYAEKEKLLVAEWKARPKGHRGSLRELLKKELNLPSDHWYLKN